MGYILRDYQKKAIDKAVLFFKSSYMNYNSLMVLPTGSGKSLVIAGIIKELNEPTIVFQPTKEILEQNLEKALTYGIPATVYSASMGKKDVSNITYATIGSAINNPHLFDIFKYVIIDECHYVNSKGGMYKNFLELINHDKVLGLTATPYRLSSDGFGGSILKFLTRTRPRVFKELLYYVQTSYLIKNGYWAKLEYFSIPGFERKYLEVNSTGADYKDESVKKYYSLINFRERVLESIRLLLRENRKRILIFTRFIEEAEYVKSNIEECEVVTSLTPTKERDEIIRKFRSGEIKAVANVGVLTIGFDYPELDNIVIARPTMSLALYYQMIGRGTRPHKDKEYCAIVDLCSNIELFGRVETMQIVDGKNGKWHIENNGKQLTNVYYGVREES